jgi:hypothetical protein
VNMKDIVQKEPMIIPSGVDPVGSLLCDYCRCSDADAMTTEPTRMYDLGYGCVICQSCLDANKHKETTIIYLNYLVQENP